MKGMIPSLADTDLYKLTMHRLISTLYPNVQVRYQLFDRSSTRYPAGFGAMLREQVDMLADIRFDHQSLEYLHKHCSHFLPYWYLTNLEGVSIDPKRISIDQDGDQIEVTSEGYWQHCIWDEILVMALANEVYNTLTDNEPQPMWFIKTANDARKIQTWKLKVADFGSRRRHSHGFHQEAVKILSPSLVGTSNVYFAARNDLRPIGTMAHELFSVIAALFGVQSANRRVLEDWVHIYEGALGVALPDTFTTPVFMRDFDLHFARGFSGLRQDSGDPLVFLDRALAHYQKVGMTADEILNRSIVFSDGLNISKATEIARACIGRIGCSFGIGTYFSNPGTPLNIVMKVVAATRPGHPWYPTIKLSDTEGKVTGATDTKEQTAQAYRHLLMIS